MACNLQPAGLQPPVLQELTYVHTECSNLPPSSPQVIRTSSNPVLERSAAEAVACKYIIKESDPLFHNCLAPALVEGRAQRQRLLGRGPGRAARRLGHGCAAFWVLGAALFLAWERRGCLEKDG